MNPPSFNRQKRKAHGSSAIGKEYEYLIEELEMKEDIALYEKVKADKNESYIPLKEYLTKEKEKIMAGCEVLLSKAARKELADLPLFIHKKITEGISHLSSISRPAALCIG